MKDASEIRRAARSLRASARGFGSFLEDVRVRYADYRDEVRERKVAEERARMEAQVKDEARLAVAAAREAVELRRHRARFAREAAEERIDHARVDRLRAELAAQIALGVGGSQVSASGAVQGDMVGDPRLRLVRDALERAKETRDAELARAVRLAGAEVVGEAARGPSSDPATMQARHLARELNAAADMAADAPALREVAEMEAALEDLAATVRSVEQQVTGTKPDVFTTVTPWERDVLGRSPEDYGGGVVWKSKPPLLESADGDAAAAEAA